MTEQNTNNIDITETQSPEQLKPNPFLENMVKTASPEQLIVILYDGVIQWLQMAKQEINKNESNTIPNWTNFAHQVKMSQKIIDHLRDSLDMSIVPDIGNKLYGLYNFYKEQIAKASVSKDKEDFNEIIKFFQGMRKTWAEALKNQRQNQRQTLGRAY